MTEESIDRYVPQESKTVTVLSGQTATVEFSNVLKKFTVTLTKSDSEKGEAQGDATLEKADVYKRQGEAKMKEPIHWPTQWLPSC